MQPALPSSLSPASCGVPDSSTCGSSSSRDLERDYEYHDLSQPEPSAWSDSPLRTLAARLPAAAATHAAGDSTRSIDRVCMARRHRRAATPRIGVSTAAQREKSRVQALVLTSRTGVTPRALVMVSRSAAGIPYTFSSTKTTHGLAFLTILSTRANSQKREEEGPFSPSRSGPYSTRRFSQPAPLPQCRQETRPAILRPSWRGLDRASPLSANRARSPWPAPRGIPRSGSAHRRARGGWWRATACGRLATRRKAPRPPPPTTPGPQRCGSQRGRRRGPRGR